MTDRAGRPGGHGLDAARLHAALAALGLRDIHTTDPQRPIDRGWLLGVLLALTETAMVDDRADTEAGYRWMLHTLAGGDDVRAARAWSLIAQDRLHRTAGALPASDDGPRPDLVDVAGPAVMAAANVMSLLHHLAASPALVADVLTTAGTNLDLAVRALDQVRERLRGDGYEV